MPNAPTSHVIELVTADRKREHFVTQSEVRGHTATFTATAISQSHRCVGSQDDMRDWLRAINGVIDTLALNPPPDGSKTPLRRARSATALSTGSRRSFSDQGAGVSAFACVAPSHLHLTTHCLHAAVYHFQLSPLLQ